MRYSHKFRPSQQYSKVYIENQVKKFAVTYAESFRSLPAAFGQLLRDVFVFSGMVRSKGKPITLFSNRSPQIQALFAARGSLIYS